MAPEGPSSIWELLPRNPEASARLEQELGVHPLVASLLAQRGFCDPGQADRFLNPSLDHLSRPEDLPDFRQAVGTLLAAKESGDLVYIHGDYDVDGVTSAAILFRFLSKAGFQVVGHVPHRETEGYGIHIDTVRRAHAAGAKLLLTCDCGSSAHTQLAAAYELGMKVVVTDHHECPEELPPAEAVVNPHRRGFDGPGKELSGAGIAFLVCLGLCRELGLEEKFFYQNFLDLAVMGTVADVMPLRDNNRVIARFGLPAIQATQKRGLRSLLSVSKLDDPGMKLTTRHIGYQLGPRINAVGRIDDADVAFRLLTTADQAEANQLAQFLDTKNQERRSMQDRIVTEACDRIAAEGLDKRSAIVIAAEGWPKGIVGIVAGKVVERFRRPAFVLGIHGDTASGSARSIPAFNLFEAIEANRALLIKGGGHAAAAGVTMETVKIPSFADALESFASARLSAEDFLPRVVADLEASISDATLQSAQAIAALEPFGEANPQPAFLMRGLKLAANNPTRNPAHSRVMLESGGRHITAMAFGLGEALSATRIGTALDLICELEEDVFNGNVRLKSVVRDFRLAEG